MLDRLTLDQLRALIAVADSGSFSAAARKLGRVQSAISQSVQSLESTLGAILFDRDGKTPKLNEAGRVILEDARHLVRSAEALRARAESLGSQTEPELTLAIDSMFPNAVLMESLRAFGDVFPNVPVTLFTEGLGAPEQRLRDGVARLAIYSPLATGAQDLESEFLTSIEMVPVVAHDHPLSGEAGPIDRGVLERYVQLVLTDPTPMSAGLRGGILSLRIWRFADLGTRLDYLLAGFGWCNMPLQLVEDHIAAGRLKRLDVVERPNWFLPMHVVNERGRPPGLAGRWLIDNLRGKLPRETPASRPRSPGRKQATRA
jgi:DNA-binding transcriptional LysR family regulator